MPRTQTSGNSGEFVDNAVMNLNMPNIGGGIDQVDSALHLAAVKGDLKKVKECVIVLGTPDIFNQSCYTPLMYASQRGHLEVVKYLIDQGANVNYVSGPSAETALHFAAFGGHLDVVKLLVASGADKKKMTTQHETPVDVAISARGSILIETGRIDKAELEKVIQYLQE